MDSFSDQIHFLGHTTPGELYQSSLISILYFFNKRIGQASRVPAECIRMNRNLVREGTFDLSDIETIIGRSDIAALNKSTLIERRDLAMNALEFGNHYAPCASIHPWLYSCRAVPLDRFFSVFKW